MSYKWHVTVSSNNKTASGDEERAEADRIQWCKLFLFESFGNVKTFFVDGELVGQVSRALQPGEE